MMRLNVLPVVFLLWGSVSAYSQGNSLTLLPSDSVRNFAAPAFVMKDLSGRPVSLNDYRGKVLVLDFWATWCAPCHKTLPFVLATLNRYKDDPDVKFLFVNSRERVADIPAHVKKYMARNDYTFPVVVDELIPDGKQQMYFRAFHLNFLPTRVVIDRQGVVRFESLGEVPGKTNEELSAMLAAMIESAKVAR